MEKLDMTTKLLLAAIVLAWFAASFGPEVMGWF